MSGLVVSYGTDVAADVATMIAKIDHRGPAVSGFSRRGQAIMGQNYGTADCVGLPGNHQVPFTGGNGDDLCICYDGQIGNWSWLASRYGVADGPFRDERLLLELYQAHGGEMVRHLGDSIFAFVISDSEALFAARDLLGIKTLFFGHSDGALYLSSELKGLCAVTEEVHEFPAGHSMDGEGNLRRFAELPLTIDVMDSELGKIVTDIRSIIDRSVRSRVDFSHPTAALLSGGMDSSVIALLASAIFRERVGEDARLKTFAMGVGESHDIVNARIMAAHIESDHEELIVDLGDILDVLPEVIYHLESFDPSLVRSSVSNYLISRHARRAGFDVLLSGEGGDEIFCGYAYLKDYEPENLTAKQLDCLGYLHNNASLRLDRMNQCNSVRVVAPLISGELLDYALRIPPELKQKTSGDTKIEKWVFRKAYEDELPESIAWRPKQEFSQGSGSADLLPGYFEQTVEDHEYLAAREQFPFVRSKEEYYYLRIFKEHFGAGPAIDTVGQWLTL